MKTAMVCSSVSHGNTRHVANVMAEVLSADVVESAQADPSELQTCDLVGFGSGIYNRKFHPDLLALVTSLPPAHYGKAIVYATSGFSDSGPLSYSGQLVRVLKDKGFDVLDTFSCRGLDTYGPFKIVGGLHKGRPNTADLTAARLFAKNLIDRTSPTHTNH